MLQLPLVTMQIGCLFPRARPCAMDDKVVWGYAPSHDDYDIHAMAPSPLSADVKWWVEVEKPDGTKLVGSIAPKM